MTLRIVAAAIHWGGIISLPAPARHHTIIACMDTEMGFDGSRVTSVQQGFITSEGNYVSRTEAYYIAVAAKQFEPDKTKPPNLYSEDLW